MEIVNLPQGVTGKRKSKDEDIIFQHYHATTGVVKQRGILHKNAISMVIEGSKTMRFANTSVTVNDNEFHFLSVGNCIVTMELPRAKHFESILIYFDTKMLSDFFRKYKQQVGRIRNTKKIKEQPYIAFLKNDFVRNFIASLKSLLQLGRPVSMEMKRLKFEELMLHLLEHYPLSLLAFPLSKGRDLEDLEIKNAVEVNLVKNISLEDLAFLCNLSLSTFKRRFVAIYGCPPSKWMLQKRMELAKELIVQEGQRPSEVYHKVGYENHSSFSQSFRQYFGLTPKEFQLRRLND